ncbi:uncharacterized protein LOC142571085 [Dermacentor variabilis]|uniref:uncharacterized protein LOC142571085 n=1 Tax=Dermacentor variabilis TaxID=34621 RepID=UPI003F5B6E91
MLLPVVCALFVPGVLGTEFLKKNGECPGPGRNPGQPVQSCDYYCMNGTTYYRAHYEVGTECEYDGQVGTCLPTDDAASCHSPDDPAVLLWNKKGSPTTKRPAEKPTKKQKRKKQRKRNNGTKSSKKPKLKKNKDESTTLPVC